MRTLACACSALLLIGTTAAAQTASPQTPATQTQLPLVPGMRVRITATNLVAPLIANYLEASADTLKFVEGRGVWSLTLDQITKLEVTLGEKTRHREYVVKYGAIGAGVGAVLFGFYASNNHPGDQSKDYSLIGTAALGAGVGGLVGGYLGSRASAEKWRAVSLPKKLAFGPDATGRWRFGATVTF